MSRRAVALTPLDQGSTALGVPCALRAGWLADGQISTAPVMKRSPHGGRCVLPSPPPARGDCGHSRGEHDASDDGISPGASLAPRWPGRINSWTQPARPPVRGRHIINPPASRPCVPRGRMRYLSSEELAAFREHCPKEWQPLFMLLFSTGMTISEALGLRRSDIDLRTRRVSIHEEYGRTLKRESRARELSIPTSVVALLVGQPEGIPASPEARGFPFTCWPARKAWSRVCKAAGIVAATIHDARHTFAVHAVQGGIPEARLQKLPGHAHPRTTRRYAMHSPEQFQDADADRVASHMGLAAPGNATRAAGVTP